MIVKTGLELSNVWLEFIKCLEQTEYEYLDTIMTFKNI